MPKRSKLSDEERNKRKRESAKRWNRNNRERFNENKRKSYSKRKDVAKTSYSYSKEYRRSWSLEKKYGITLEDYEGLFEGQGSKCAVCSSDTPGSKTNWYVDHCHVTKKVRGILCHHCNTMLGMARDNTAFLAAGIEYLERNASG